MGILAHGPHAMVRVGPLYVVRTQTGVTDGRYTYGILTAPLSHSITRAWYSSVADFSNELSRISEHLVGVTIFA